VNATFLMEEQRLKESNSLMTSTEPDWETIRQQLTSALGHDLDETAWQALSALSLKITGELIWRVEALRPQVPVRGTIYFRPIRSLSADAPGTCSLCGDPLPAVGRFRCDSCAIAAQLVLGQPIQLAGLTARQQHTNLLPKGGEDET
jgi:hypothetical protein